MEMNNSKQLDMKVNGDLNGQNGALRLQVVNISGTKFHMLDELWVKIKKKIPRKFQGEMHAFEDEVFVARDHRAFQAILNEQLGSELHMPSDMCPSVFRKELEYWGIEETDLAKCCFVKYMAYFEDQDALKILEEDEKQKTTDRMRLESMSHQHGWRGFQAKIWLILNEPYHSNYSKVYFILHVLLITISLFALVAGTHHSFQRPLNINEWKLYFGNDWDDYKHHFYDADVSSSDSQADVESSAEPEVESEAEPEVNAESEAETESQSNSSTSAYVQTTPEPSEMSTTELSTDPEPCDEEVQAEDDSESLPLPENTRARFLFLDIIEFFSIACFTIDLIVRLVICPFKYKLLFSFLHWVDVFALAVMYAKYIVEAIYPKEKYEASVLDILHCLQVVRILQMFRLVQNSVGFRVLLYAFKASFTELMHMSLFLFVAMLLFSTLIYFSGDLNFPNIPDAFWWSLITMTTVGYGDMVPKQPLSRFIGVLCAITGVCVIAVIIPIFVNNFMLFYTYSKVWGRKNDHSNRKIKVTQVAAADTPSSYTDRMY
ncbi:potassium voltage-gated channel protein Shaw-like [Mercenaria mercenaria]|uniref:potassium voltage-gated channel protein Shaw-like n=1 Tax=Mercenaria mercenaria TaxID=6596 RepID=UPI00234E5DB6|nr:potassium voltage-gated channel protein Shaw-like [Mercenaria mercenaria]